MLGGWRRWRRGEVRWQATPAWTQAVSADWPDWLLEAPVTDRFHAKQGRSTGRWVVRSHPPLVVYLKRHYRLPLGQRLCALLWPGLGVSPARQEARGLRLAQGLGLPVPETVLAAEWIGPGLKLQSALAIAELTGQWAVNEALPQARDRWPPQAVQQWKKQVGLEIARLTALLHRAGWFHQDLYLCHFYVALPLEGAPLPTVGPGAVTLIDWQRLVRRRWLPWAAQVKDLAQLLYSSWTEGVTAADRLRWWRAYCVGMGITLGSRYERLLTWAVRFKAERYRRHNRQAKASPWPEPASGRLRRSA
ncbi:MAG TPA: lipopolysaccharide kinase InaA family protein [Gemmatales bacterium]|nr:lipopolysaccharide kinase InaA family protein [Gemmatales bacterium]HMP60435.1 lipopolysaccharide kinase InaA family protein [Gemmatales bacterium]